LSGLRMCRRNHTLNTVEPICQNLTRLFCTSTDLDLVSYSAGTHAHAREDYGTNQNVSVSPDKGLRSIYMLAHENSRSLSALSVFFLHRYVLLGVGYLPIRCWKQKCLWEYDYDVVRFHPLRNTQCMTSAGRKDLWSFVRRVQSVVETSGYIFLTKVCS
jgi:hypothetical protein